MLSVQGLDPSEAVNGIGFWFVFTSNPTGIADGVNVPEQPRVVDLASAGFVAARVVGQLDVANTCQVVVERVAQFALHALRVVDVVLDEEVVTVHVILNGRSLIGAVQKETRNVEIIDGLHQQAQTRHLELFCSERQVGNQRGS